MLFELARMLFCLIFEFEFLLEGIDYIFAELWRIPTSKHTSIDCFPAAIRKFNFGATLDVAVICVPWAQEFREPPV